MIVTVNKGKAQKLTKNFKSTEFDCKCQNKNCSKTLIDTELMSYLQLIRTHFNKAVSINSGYRCETHNKAVGGVASSQHLKGTAADIVVKGVSPDEVASYCSSIGVNGIGIYKTFTHIDTRASKATWRG